MRHSHRSADTVVETGAGIRTGDEILGPGERAYVRREELNPIQIRSQPPIHLGVLNAHRNTNAPQLQHYNFVRTVGLTY
jgi:hypothetical protein